MVASRGPVPKRSDQRRRTNQPGDGMEVTKAPGASDVPMPAPDPEWHSLAHRWYTSLRESGQARFYEPSDWATAQVLAELLSRSLKSSRMNSQIVTAFLSGASDLLTTEGQRRRMRLELQRGEQVDEDEDAAVASIEKYRDRLAGGS